MQIKVRASTDSWSGLGSYSCNGLHSGRLPIPPDWSMLSESLPDEASAPLGEELLGALDGSFNVKWRSVPEMVFTSPAATAGANLTDVKI